MSPAHAAGVLLLALAVGLGLGDVARAQAPADTTGAGGLVDELRRRDLEFFDPQLFDFPEDLRDSTFAAFDSLGFEGYRDQVEAPGRRFGLSFGVADRLLDYNRTEGLVGGAGVTVRPRGSRGPRLDLQGAYATGPEEFRHRETLGWRFRSPVRLAAVEVGYADQVVPFGSNRPGWNAVRALLGGTDEQDYLRRRGGWLGGAWAHRGLGTLRLNYQAARENAVSPTTDVSLFGDLEKPNPPAAEGIDRALAAQVVLGSITEGTLLLDVTHRVAGGSLGGDFDYARTDARLVHRRYLLRRHEVQLDLRATRAGGSPPIQRLADLGGITTLRGYERRSRVGRRSLAARLEYLVPYDFLGRSGIPGLRELRLQFVPWVDAGRVWDGVSGAPTTSAEAAGASALHVASDRWLTSAGLGVQTYLGPFDRAAYLRLDLAAPMGPDRGDDLRVYLRLAARNF